MDVLSDLFAAFGVRGTAGARIGASGTWGVTSSPSHGLALYAITAGTAYLTVEGRPAVPLDAGDVVLVSSEAMHMLSSEPDVPSEACRLGSAERSQREGEHLSFGDGEARTKILCAAYAHDGALSASVFGLLPTVVHVAGSAADPDVADSVRLLGRELARPRVATSALLDRLVDIMLIQLLRVWLSSGPTPEVSWWGVLRDPLLHRAVTLLHEDPARAWSAESLAREVAASKSTLTRRFLSATGDTPGAYLTRWRMTLASKRLRDTDDTLESIATSVGYSSVYAFSRAFHRECQMPPARYRKVAAGLH